MCDLSIWLSFSLTVYLDRLFCWPFDTSNSCLFLQLRGAHESDVRVAVNFFVSLVVEPERIGEEFDGAETNENSRTFGARGLFIFRYK